MRVNLLRKLALELQKISSSDASKKTNNLADIMAGKKKIIKTPKALFEFLKENEDLKINIDSPKGSKKGFGDKKKVLPFDYGEIVGAINPADMCFWDVIIPPSEKNLNNRKVYPIGIIRYSIPERIGNDKIIVSSDGILSQNDKLIIENFFNDMNQFHDVEWFV
jgi:hypothetical protein